MKKLIFLTFINMLAFASFSQGTITGDGFEFYKGDSLIELEYKLQFTVSENMSGSLEFKGIEELEGIPVKFEKFSFENNALYASNFESWGYKEINLFEFKYPSFEKASACILHFDFIPLENKYEIKILDGVNILYKFEIHVLNFDNWTGPLFFKRTFRYTKVDIYDMKVDKYELDTTFIIGYHVEINDREFIFTNDIIGSEQAKMKIYSLFIADNGFELFFFDNNDRIMMPNRSPIPEIALSVEYNKETQTYKQIHMITD